MKLKLLPYSEITNHELQHTKGYAEADKQLSFVVYDVDNNVICCAISLVSESYDCKFTQDNDLTKGCKILDLAVIKQQGIAHVGYLDKLWEEAKDRCTMWVDDNGELAFDYIWFNVKDDFAIDIINQYQEELKMADNGNVICPLDS